MSARFGCGTRVAVALAASLVPRAASAAGVEVRCARLSRAQIEELDARARLTLALRPRPDLDPITVACDANRAWLETPADRDGFPIDERQGLVEGALTALEMLAHLPPTAIATSTPISSPPSSPPSTPNTSPAEVSSRPVPHSPSTGGIGLGAVFEPWPHAGGVSLGPKLDIALPLHGALAIVATESVRFGLAPGRGPATSLVDVQAGVAWGAPYATRRPLGFVLLVGVERFAASPADDKLRSADVWAGTASLGTRAALRAGPLEVWLGLDGVLRAAPLETSEPVRAELPRIGAVVSLGFLYPAESVVRSHAE